MEAIEFRKLSFAYPGCEKLALDRIQLVIRPSEYVLLCGKSGCGKTTLLRQIKRNLIPYGDFEGEVLYYGKNVKELDQRVHASEIGFVQQNPDSQIVTDKVWHELAFGLENLGLKQEVIRRRVSEMASFFGIQTWFRKNISELSGGQKQLLNLASIMAMQPKVLILDEPTSQLDPIAASDFLQMLTKINRELGTTILLSEHRLEEVFPEVDRVLVMDDSKVVEFDAPKQVAQHIADGDDHGMYYGLPAVMRIFTRIQKKGSCPLTVREGRSWLESLLKNKPMISTEKKADKKQHKSEKSTKTTVITMRDTWFRYNRKEPDILKGVTFQVRRGEWLSILGGNGVGKSTTLKAICGLVKPYRGSISVEGKSAMLPQNPQALFTEITVEEELLEALYEVKLSDEEKVKQVNHMLEEMGLSNLQKSHPYDLSGGEQQRLALGKILLRKPSILLLDEPTKGLDPFFKRTLAGILQKNLHNGVTIVMVSHDIEFCAEYADRCGLFFDGSVMSLGTTRAFFSGNSFYTTTANRLARQWFPEAVTCEEVVQQCKELLS